MVGEHVAAILEPSASPASLPEAQALCLGMTRTHYENFSVLSSFVPRDLRVHVAALYAFCRTVDDLGDEAPGDRLAHLDRFEAELDAAFNGQPHHPVLVALRETIRRFDLPREPLERLIEANRIDQRVRSFATFDDLLHYCEHSANPVGRLFLLLFGYRDEARFALSDATCTALQLTNFWQDIARDRAMGRIYLPQSEMAEFGISEAHLDAGGTSEGLRSLVRFQVERTRRYFAEGLPLLDTVRGRLRLALALFSRGGLAILDRIEAQDFDTLDARPTLGRSDKIRLAISSILSSSWRRRL